MLPGAMPPACSQLRPSAAEPGTLFGEWSDGEEEGDAYADEPSDEWRRPRAEMRAVTRPAAVPPLLSAPFATMSNVATATEGDGKDAGGGGGGDGGGGGGGGGGQRHRRGVAAAGA